ncbi:CaiB/BaiF CoA-transferase family protein [Catellatospora sp. NPDC049609]|uniref:CaiB/BaiF CoA transferase family protein n=1 Tax=Catellatospora sp. NPDC049609 TaxID=3155505 RepID=UPI0034367D68
MGPLHGLKVIELGGQGPGPFGAMFLADLGAEVIRIDRPAEVGKAAGDPVLRRGRRSVAVDLKHPRGVAVAKALIDRTDVLIEGYRPGVTERLGLGPDVFTTSNPRLVYARMTGWGQDGPLARVAGHDVNYSALAGVIGAIGRPGTGPVIPINLIADFGGGGMLLAVGVLAALHSRAHTGKGQVVDVAMVDGAAALLGSFYAAAAMGLWTEPGTNPLDGGAYFYDTYETADGGHVAFGAIEPQFHRAMLETLGLDPADFAGQEDRTRWPARKKQIADVVRRRTRDEWVARFDGVDACFSPVLTLAEVPRHPHHVARGGFVEIDGLVQPAPAPRFGGTPAARPAGVAPTGGATRQVLAEHGFADADIEQLLASGAIGATPRKDSL